MKKDHLITYEYYPQTQLLNGVPTREEGEKVGPPLWIGPGHVKNIGDENLKSIQYVSLKIRVR